MKLSDFHPNPRIPYQEVAQRLKHLPWGRCTRLGLVSDYPLFVWRFIPPQPIQSVLLSAGIHGDEPSGVECLLMLLENHPSWLRGFDLTVFPCLNPWGYEHHMRVNEQGSDVNRLWKNNPSQEVLLARRVLNHHRFDLTLCLHEDYDATGFYLYELSRHKIYDGPIVTKVVSRILPIDSRIWIERRRASHGVVTRPLESIRRRKKWPEALCHFMHYTDHTLTTETPSSFPIKKRIQAHTEAIRVMFKLLHRHNV